jgi:hypothetical protein
MKIINNEKHRNRTPSQSLIWRRNGLKPKEEFKKVTSGRAKIIVAVIVYNRFDNLKRWINCWKYCNKLNAELVVVHNLDLEDNNLKYEQLCRENNIQYIQRENVGFDIGAFQDICKERLEGFPNNWDNLIWITDDTIPMQKNFVSIYLDKLRKGFLPCYEISDQVKTHIRTTGFLVTKNISKKLVFPKDPIITKEDCYVFEHKGLNLYKQIKNMGFKPHMISDLKHSPLWDSGCRGYLQLLPEHERIFPPISDNLLEEISVSLDSKKHKSYFDRWGERYKEFSNEDTVVFTPKPSEKLSPTATLALNKKVTFICPIYNTFPEIISSLLLQTFDNWELYLVHDGKNATGLKEYVEAIGDTRIIYNETTERLGSWGFPIRRDVITQIKDGTLPKTDYIVVTNPDNYHTPFYVEKYLMEMCKNPNITIGAYCSQMVHNYVDYKVMDCSLQRGYIDSAAIMFRADVACDMGWSNIHEFHSDWIYIDNIIKKHGTTNIVKIDGCHLIHN